MPSLQLARAVGLAADDAAKLAALSSLTHFEWFAEDVPDKVWVPVRDVIAKPRTQAMHPEEWFAARAQHDRDARGGADVRQNNPFGTTSS